MSVYVCMCVFVSVVSSACGECLYMCVCVWIKRSSLVLIFYVFLQ